MEPNFTTYTGDTGRACAETAPQEVELQTYLLRVKAAPNGQRNALGCGNIMIPGYCTVLPNGQDVWLEKETFECMTLRADEGDVPEPEVGGKPGGMSFAGAISCIRSGEKVRRAAWMEGYFVFLADNVEFHAAAEIVTHENKVDVGDMLVLGDGEAFFPGWTPDHDDLLADDWEVD